MADTPGPLPSLEALQSRLEQAAPEEKPEAPPIDARGMAVLPRLAVELLAGVLVGLSAGYFLDRWLGTSPWLMLLFLFLGAGAGFLNLVRAAEELDKQGS